MLVTVGVAPANAVPTAVTTVGTPNGRTGVVTGAIVGFDGESDALFYSASDPAKGAVVMNADGSFTYTPSVGAYHAALAAAAAGASAAELSDVFTATITDGHGGVMTVAVTVMPVTTNDLPAANKLVSNSVAPTPSAPTITLPRAMGNYVLSSLSLVDAGPAAANAATVLPTADLVTDGASTAAVPGAQSEVANPASQSIPSSTYGGPDGAAAGVPAATAGSATAEPSAPSSADAADPQSAAADAAIEKNAASKPTALSNPSGQHRGRTSSGMNADVDADELFSSSAGSDGESGAESTTASAIDGDSGRNNYAPGAPIGTLATLGMLLMAGIPIAAAGGAAGAAGKGDKAV